MEFGKPVIVSVEDFFKDMKPIGSGRNREYTEMEQNVIRAAYEKGYNKEETARRLKTSPKDMKRWYLANKKDGK